MPTAISPQVATGPMVVDLQASAVDLACRLGCLNTFVDAAETLLLTAYELHSSAFRRQSKKVVTLIEISRKTLSGAGISPYFLCPGKATSTAFKAVYIDLLHMLDERFDDLESDYRARAHNLLAPLHSQSIRVVKGSDALHTEPTNLQKRRSRFNSASEMPYDRYRYHESAFITASEGQVVTRSQSMPPPDAWSASKHPNPLAGLHPKERKARTRASVAAMEKQFGPSWRSNNSESDQENIGQQPLSIKPLRQRFGIYCTKNTSMYR